MSEITQLSDIRSIDPLGGLSPSQMATIGKLLTAKSITGAARAAGVAPSTIYEWLHQPAFRAGLADAFRERFALLNIEAVRLGTLAFRTLEEVMRDPTAPAMARVGAASRTIDAIHRSYELTNVTERLDKLEGLLESGHGQA